MKKIQTPIAIILMCLVALLNFPPATLGASAKTKIKHKPVKKALSGQRIALEAEVKDPAGVDEVRAYFKALEAKDYAFVRMVNTGDDRYKGTLPAPARGVQAIDYLILVKNGANQVVKSQTFRIEVKDSDKHVAAARPIQVYTELAKAPETIVGFDDNIVVDVVESAAKFGVVAGLYSKASAGAGAASAGGAAGSGATSAGTVVATGGGMGIGATVAAVAVAAGGAAAAAASNSDSGGGNSDNGGLQGASGDVRVNIGWNNCSDVDLHVTDPCGNEIYFGNPSAICQGFVGALDVDTNVDNCVDDPQENIVWTNGAPVGTYQVTVVQFNDKGNTLTSVRVTTIVDGSSNTTNFTLGPTGDSRSFNFVR